MTKEELIKLSRENLRKSKQGSLCECYDEAFIKGYELSEKQIAELEKENKVLAQNLEDTEIVNKALEKENAELKEQIAELSKHIVELQNDKGELIDRCRELETRCNELFLQTMQLTNAKELLKRYVPYRQITDSKAYKDLAEETEQFISEVEK